LQNISFTYILRAMPAQPLTKEQLEDAARLKERFLDWQAKRRSGNMPASQEAASELLGFNQSAMSQYLNGRIPLNVNAATKFSSVLGCSISDFSPSLATHAAGLAALSGVPLIGVALANALSGDANEPDIWNGGEPGSISGALPVRMGDEADTIPIRRVKLKLRAGISGYETEPEMDDGGVLNVPRRVIDRNNYVPHQLLAVTVHGCSMEPMLFEDDVVVINTADRKPANRELFAVNFNGEACVKQLWQNAGQWFLRSMNPDFGPVNVRSGQCDIVGRVVYQPGRELTGRL
jgi:hypothetical protein